MTNGVNQNGTPMQLHDCNSSPAQQWTISNGSLRAYGRCLDIPGGYAANYGYQLQLHDCNGTAAQSWQVGEGEIRTTPRCLGAAGDGKTSGTLIEIFDCLGSTGQKWLPRDDGSILNPESTLCLDLRFADTADFAVIQLHECNSTIAQKWKFVF